MGAPEHKTLGPARFTWTCKQCGRIVPQHSWLKPETCAYCPPPRSPYADLGKAVDEFWEAFWTAIEPALNPIARWLSRIFARAMGANPSPLRETLVICAPALVIFVGVLLTIDLR